MKVLIINQFFWPDHSAVAQLAGDLAEDLAAAGHQVTVLCSRGSYLGGATLPARDHWRGVTVRRVRSSGFGKRRLLGRLADYLTFLGMALLAGLLLPRQDVVVATSSPPFLPVVGAVLRWLRGSRLVLWLQDVYPELAVSFGLARAGTAGVRLAMAVARGLYRHSDAVVVLGTAMAQHVRRAGGPSVRVHVIPNWADGSLIRPVSHQANAFRREIGLEGKRVVLYSGNMGRAHDLATLLGAARSLQAEADLVFVFIGDGARRPEVEAAARDIKSIRLLPYQDRTKLSESLSAGDVHVVTQQSLTLGLMEPSKLYGVLAAGRPTLFIGPLDSEAAATIRQEQVGEVVACGDVEGAVRALQRLLGDASAMGSRAREAFLRSYDRPHRTTALLSVLVPPEEPRRSPAC